MEKVEKVWFHLWTPFWVGVSMLVWIIVLMVRRLDLLISRGKAKEHLNNDY